MNSGWMTLNTKCRRASLDALLVCPGAAPTFFPLNVHGSSELRAWQGRGQEAWSVGTGQAVAADVKAAGELFRAD